MLQKRYIKPGLRALKPPLSSCERLKNVWLLQINSVNERHLFECLCEEKQRKKKREFAGPTTKNSLSFWTSTKKLFLPRAKNFFARRLRFRNDPFSKTLEQLTHQPTSWENVQVLKNPHHLQGLLKQFPVRRILGTVQRISGQLPVECNVLHNRPTSSAHLSVFPSLKPWPTDYYYYYYSADCFLPIFILSFSVSLCYARGWWQLPNYLLRRWVVEVDILAGGFLPLSMRRSRR